MFGCFACMDVWALGTRLMPKETRKYLVSDPLGLESQMDSNQHVSAGNRTQVL